MGKAVITIIGSGRVAEALAVSFHEAGHEIGGVISRNRDTASALAARVSSNVLKTYQVPDDNGLVIMAVPDDSIYSLSRKLHVGPSTIVVHTSGSTGMEVFPESISHTGVIYPLQSFTNGRKANLGEVHFFTEASDAGTLRTIDLAVSSVSPNIHHIDSIGRSKVHLAAVFISNFANHMLYCGMEIARREGLDMTAFAPLIRETVEKALDMGPATAQTGPASRNDISTMAKHMDMLSFSDDMGKLYKIVSDSIIRSKI